MPDSQPLPTTAAGIAPAGSPELVAVVVVHGVADQAPHDSARAIVDLLATLNSPRQQAYGAFVEDDLRIDVEPLAGAKGVTEGFTRICDKMAAAAPSPAAPAELRDEPDVALMRDMLAEHRPDAPEVAYRTVRLRGRRTADGRVVDVHEMYWADLSRVGRGALRMLGELYQVLFHVASLGRHVTDAAAATDARDNRAWAVLRRAHRTAAYLLTVPLPLLNLWMLACVAIGSAVVGVGKLPERLQAAPALGVIALGLLGLLALRRVGWRRPFLLWAATPIVVTGGVAALHWVVAPFAVRLTAYVALAIVWIAGEWLVRTYEVMRPEARRFGLASIRAVMVALAVALAFRGGTVLDVMTACLWLVEIVYLLSAVVWALFFTAQITAAIAGRVARGRALPDDVRLRLTRADRTARLTLALPVVVFILLTMTLWSGLFVAATTVIPKGPYPALWADDVRLTVPTAADLPAPGAAAALTHADGAWILIETAAPEMLLLVAIAGVTLLIAIWSALPSIVAEVRPPDAADDPAPIGQWLDRGFRFLWVAGVLMVTGCVISVVVAVGHVWFLAHNPPLVALDAPRDWSTLDRAIPSYFVQSAFLLKWFGGALAGTALGLVAFGGRLKQLTGGLRPILDVLLDVDNYLREHPKRNNPRARIVSRYASLLRHVCTWRDDAGQGYDRLVIVSHSQGTVITTDLLRYLTAYPDDALKALGSSIRVHVVTMGSPLRQLYGRRFPHLYRWAYHGDAAGPDDPLPAARVPLPQALGIDTWTNLYGSGDYIGRYLWYRDESEGRWTPLAGPPPALAPVPPQLRREWCVGPGAHTHYWDRSSAPVAAVLHQVLGW